MAPSTPPFLPGLPLIGNLHQFLTDPIPLLRAGHAKYGRIFAVRLAGKRMAVLLGPEYNRFFFEQTDKLLSMREGYPFLVPMFDGEWFFVAPFDEYKAQKKIILPAFSPASMSRYLDIMTLETLAFMDSLGSEGEFDAVAALGPLVMNIASHAFLGDDFRKRMGGEFFGLFNTWAGFIEPRLPSWLPLPRYRRARRARTVLHSMVQKLIDERRQPGSRKDDFLQVLIEAKYADGQPLSDLTVINLILFLVWAGHETTSGQISWALIQLLQHPQYLETVLAEQDSVLDTNPHLTTDQARSLKRIEWAIKETERTRPVAYVLLRGTREPVEVGGYTIPAGWMVATAAGVSHFLPDVFTNPDRWDPERFSPEREEDRQPYSLIGFGGGTHRCLGAHFASLEMRVVLTLLLQRYDLELVDKDPQPARRPSARWPKSPTRIRYRLRDRSNCLKTTGTSSNAAACPAEPNGAAPKAHSGKCPFHRS